MATLTITQTEDYRDGNPAIPANTTSIVFSTSADATATFAASQFGGTPISDSVQITGDGDQDFNHDVVAVFLSGAGSFSAAGWTFSSWSVFDSVTITGSSGADTITGSSGNDVITGGHGADILDGGGGNNDFVFFA